MEALYQPFQQIAIDAVSLQGLLQMVFIAGVLIFKLVMPAPKQKEDDSYISGRNRKL